jgi:NIPSNAP
LLRERIPAVKGEAIGIPSIFPMETIAMIVEMRTYKTKPGKRSEFLEIFRTKSIPAHAEIGMRILGPFLSVEDPDTFFFMRGFPDLASREPMKAKFYEGELWKRELENVLMPMLEKYDVVLVDDPEGTIRWQQGQEID